MQEFLESVKKRRFRIPCCTLCRTIAWPPSNICPRCLSSTSLKKAGTRGRLIEFARSTVKNKRGMFGVVDLQGIKLIASLVEQPYRSGMKVKMIDCGVDSDGRIFYVFGPLTKNTRH